MSKLPKVSKRTWKEFVPSKWMIWACEDNDVHHLVLDSGKVVWKRTGDIDDCSDVVVFNKLGKAKEFIRKCIKKKLLPSKKINNIDYAMVVPTFEDGKLWYEVVNPHTGKVENKTKGEKV